MKFPCAFLLIAGLTISDLAGQSKVDSLERIVQNSMGVVKYDAVISIMRILFNDEQQIGSAMAWASEAVLIAKQLGDTSRIVKATRIKGQLHAKLEQVDESLTELYSILDMARNTNSDQLRYITNLIGLNLTLRARYSESLSFLNESLQLWLTSDDTSGVQSVINNLGVVYYKMKLYDKALGYFERCITLCNGNNSLGQLENCLTNAGLCHAYSHRYSKALVLLQKAIAYNRRSKIPFSAISSYFALGVVYEGMGKLNTASVHFNKSLDIATRTNTTRFIAENCYFLGRIELKVGQITKGLALLKRAEAVCRQYGYDELLITVFQEMLSYFAEIADFENERLYRDSYITLQANIYNQQLTVAIATAELDIQRRQNSSRISGQNEVLVIKKRILSQQRLTILLICTASALLTAIIFFQIFQGYQRKLINKALDASVAMQTVSLSAKFNELQGQTGKLRLTARESGKILKQTVSQYHALIRLHDRFADKNMLSQVKAVMRLMLEH